MKKNWYVASTMNDQGLVIEEETGRNVAVTYDAKDAPIVAAAPELLRAAEKVVSRWESGNLAEAVRELAAAIAKAKGDQS